MTTRKLLFVLLPAMALGLAACSNTLQDDYDISVEFPAQEALQDVTVLFAESGQADIVVGEGAVVKTAPEGALVESLAPGLTLVQYRNLSLVSGACADADIPALLENTFWSATGRGWIFALTIDGTGRDFRDCGFVECLSDRNVPSDGTLVLMAGSSIYDKISSVSGSPLSFTVSTREASL